MLTDLDELTLRCRSEKAKVHLVEAVGCYRAGAYRASIVATWIAVAFDMIDKLGELALAGDAVARTHLEKAQSARALANLRAALDFEREIPKLALDLEFISPVEFIDLERLIEDRNRCAHPSMLADEIAFAPPAELARLHICNAVGHLLSREPVQGKAALDSLLRDLSSDYFPKKLADARLYLKSSALHRPRVSLLTDFVAVCLKSYSLDSEPTHGQVKYLHVLQVARELHPASWEQAMAVHFPLLAARCHSPEEMFNLASVTADFSPTPWNTLNDAQKLRLGNYIADLPVEKLHALKRLDVSQLREPLHARIGGLRPAEFRHLGPFDEVPRVATERALKLLRDSVSTSSTTTLLQFLFNHHDELTLAEVEHFLVTVNLNKRARAWQDKLQFYEALIERVDAESEGIKKAVMLSDDYTKALMRGG